MGGERLAPFGLLVFPLCPVDPRAGNSSQSGSRSNQPHPDLLRMAWGYTGRDGRDRDDRPGYILSGFLTGSKLIYLFQLLLPLGFLSLLSPASCIMIIVPALEGLLSSRPQHFSIQYQYTALIIPFVFISAIRGTRNLLRWKWLKFKPDYLVIFLLLISPPSARMLRPLFRLPCMFQQWG